MKIYQTIKEARETTLTNLPGIYYFRNKINNKYYIGQALSIRQRFKGHCHSILVNANYPIYKAINKYGEENFEIGIIGVLKNPEPKEIIKKKLDILEVKYIKEYNSYGATGYNQTFGGDGGILGYKMTEEQIKILSENSKKVMNDGRHTIYVYDLKEDKEYTFTTCRAAAEQLQVNRDCLYSALKRKGICNKRYVISQNMDSLKNLVNSFKEKLNEYGENKNSGMFEEKYSLEEYIKIKNNNPNFSAKELASLMKVCLKTIYNYEHLLPNPTFKQKEETKYKIINTLTKEEYIVNAKDGGKLFNLSDKQFRKTEKYCRDHSSLYKKTYKIIRLNNL